MDSFLAFELFQGLPGLRLFLTCKVCIQYSLFFFSGSCLYLSIACLTIVSYFLYDQKLDAAGIVGISLIVIGVVILRFMSETGELAG